MHNNHTIQIYIYIPIIYFISSEWYIKHQTCVIPHVKHLYASADNTSCAETKIHIIGISYQLISGDKETHQEARIIVITLYQKYTPNNISCHGNDTYVM